MKSSCLNNVFNDKDTLKHEHPTPPLYVCIKLKPPAAPGSVCQLGRAISFSSAALIIGLGIIDSPLTFTTFSELINHCLEIIQLQGANGQGLT